MQFNATGSSNTNYEEAKNKLKGSFPEDWANDFKFIWVELYIKQ